MPCLRLNNAQTTLLGVEVPLVLVEQRQRIEAIEIFSVQAGSTLKNTDYMSLYMYMYITCISHVHVHVTGSIFIDWIDLITCTISFTPQPREMGEY